MSAWDSALDALDRLVKDTSKSDEVVFDYFLKLRCCSGNGTGSERKEPELNEAQTKKMFEIIRLIEWRRPGLYLMMYNS